MHCVAYGIFGARAEALGRGGSRPRAHASRGTTLICSQGSIHNVNTGHCSLARPESERVRRQPSLVSCIRLARQTRRPATERAVPRRRAWHSTRVGRSSSCHFQCHSHHIKGARASGGDRFLECGPQERAPKFTNSIKFYHFGEKRRERWVN